MDSTLLFVRARFGSFVARVTAQVSACLDVLIPLLLHLVAGTGVARGELHGGLGPDSALEFACALKLGIENRAEKK